MVSAVAAGASQPVVAALLGLGASGLAGAVVAMAWSVHARQIRLAEQLTRRQFVVAGETEAAEPALNGHASAEAALVELREAKEAVAAQAGTKVPASRVATAARSAKLFIDGPETVVAGEQVRYRVRPAGDGKMVTWAAGGGSVSQSPDPAHPDELLLIADQPGNLMVSVRVREGLSERRETKSVTALPEVSTTPPFTLRLFLHGWGLIVVAVMVIGFAGALDALGNLTSADFIALVVPLTALLGVITVTRGASDLSPRPGRGKGPARPES
jgi:hypothetical protein